jgi:hypothetical protein
MILSEIDSAGDGMMTVLLVLCATVIMIVLLRRHQFRSTSRREMSRDHIARIRDQHKLRESMDELLLQLEEVSRRVGAQVDTKFAKLETVIRDADERIARLEGVLGRSGDTRPQPRAPGSAKREGAGETPAGGTDTPAAPNPAEPPDPRFQRVYELIDAGSSPIKAAEQLGLPLGEVELILDLRDLR